MKKQQIVARIADILKKFQQNPEVLKLFQDVTPKLTKVEIAAELRKSLDLIKSSPELLAKMSPAPIAKDDKPHAPDSPKDKAHDIVEEGESVKQAVSKVDDRKDGADALLTHLRTLRSRRQLRSKQNQEKGKAELEKARIDEGKSLEQKVRDRQARNVRDVKDTRTPSGQKTRTGSTSMRREHALEVKAVSRRPGEKIVGKPRELDEHHGVHVRQATYAPKARGIMQTGAMSEPGGNKSYRSGGKYHAPGGERAAHDAVMSGNKALGRVYTHKLGKAELESMMKADDDMMIKKGLGDKLQSMKDRAKSLASSSGGRKALAMAAALDLAAAGGAGKLAHDMIKKPEAKPPVQAQSIGPAKPGAKRLLDKAELKKELSCEYTPKFKKGGECK